LVEGMWVGITPHKPPKEHRPHIGIQLVEQPFNQPNNDKLSNVRWVLVWVAGKDVRKGPCSSSGHHTPWEQRQVGSSQGVW
jgi:hypothetical protein